MNQEQKPRLSPNAGSIAAAALATLFFCLQIFTGGGINYGLYAIIIVMPATNYTLKALKTRSSQDILVAAFFILFVLCLSTGHIYNLIVK